MGKHLGEPAEQSGTPDRTRLGKLAAGLTGVVVAWGFLVVKAVQFGSQARGGETPAWLFALFATAGATACMFAGLVLSTKVMAELRGEGPPPRTPGGGRRASR